MKFYQLLIAIFSFSMSYAQDEGCSFKQFEGHPEINFAEYTQEKIGSNPYISKKDWNKAKFDELVMVYSVFCEDMFEEAKKEIHLAYENTEILSTVSSIGHSERFEIWDVVLKSADKTYYIHFQFELSEE